MLECYVAYCANQMEATERLRSLREKDPRLHLWLQRRESDPRCRNLDLASFLLQPMQRVTRYALLLRQIANYTPEDHDDYEPIRRSVDLAEELLRRTNEAARDRADFTRLKEIAASLILDSNTQVSSRFLYPDAFIVLMILAHLLIVGHYWMYTILGATTSYYGRHMDKESSRSSSQCISIYRFIIIM
jgi:hypothetical protein